MYARAYITFDFIALLFEKAVAACVLVVVCARTHPLLLRASIIDKRLCALKLKCDGIDFHRSIPPNPTVIEVGIC